MIEAMEPSAWHLRGVILPEDEPRDLWIADGVVADEPPAEAVALASECWVLPGLVDAHNHIALGTGGGIPKAEQEAHAIADRDAGTLLIREVGSPVDTHWVDDRADLPRIIRSGAHIARPKRYIRNFAVEIAPEDLVAELELQAAAGDGWVKFVGDWIDRDVGDLAPLWPADIAAAAIARAHELGVRVTAHCFGEQAPAELVAAGIDCIEHGTGLSGEVIEQMAANGTALVPTLTNIENFPLYASQGGRFPTYQAHMEQLYANRMTTFRTALDAGVAIYAGTDAGSIVPHGLIPHEVELLADVGGADFALGAASWRARDWLGASGLEIGASADLVVYDADPRLDVTVLRRPIAVILRGRLVAGSLAA